MCREDERIREVTGLLENTTEDNRTIIFAANKQDVIKLYKVCTCMFLCCEAQAQIS